MKNPDGIVKVRTAIVSVSDKAGLTEFVEELESFGVEMLATGGTYAALKAAKVKVRSLQDDMKLPSAVSGRVKTLHAPLHAAILARRTEEHMRELEAMGVNLIDMVVCNFYPFEEVLKRGEPEDEKLVESIDIGGPTMVRAASKNFERVTVVSSPANYPVVIAEMRRTGGGTTLGLRRKLAVEAFSATSSYDAAIFNGMRQGESASFPERFALSARKVQEAKYGENPGTKAAIYSLNGFATMAAWRQLGGDEMSFNNFLDIGSAYGTMRGLDDVPAAATVKHGQISGFAFAPTLQEAYKLAHSCDPEADFGGCVVTNWTVDAETAGLIGKNEGRKDGSTYTELVVAPGFTPEALFILKAKQKKKIRIVQADLKPDYPYDVKVLEGALLVQDAVDYSVKLEPSKVTVPTRRAPGKDEFAVLLAAWELVRKVQSNGILIANGSADEGKLKRFWTLGVGSFRKRNGAVRIALENAGSRAKGAVCASDGFFPFRDSIDILAGGGISSIIQPGGSVKDGEVIRAADEHGLAMVLTHTRAFKH